MQSVQKARQGYMIVKSVFGQYEEIPESWRLKQFYEIGKIVGGGTPDTINPRYWNGKIPWAVPTDISPLKNIYINKTERYISEEGLEKSSARLLPIGTVLVTTRATIGECAINTIPMATNQGFQNIMCNSEHYNLFVYYALKFFKKRLLRLAYGTTFLEISKNNMKTVKIPVPNRAEQNKIASILSKVDELIQKTDQITEQTQRLKKGLTQKLLTKGIGHIKFKNVHLGLRFLNLSIPESWLVATLEEVTQIIDTPHYTSPYFDSGIPVIRTSNCTSSGEIDFTGSTFTSQEEYEKRRKIIDPEVGDVLYTREAPLGLQYM
jgi:type I restriction enzyme, S subunit